MGRWLQGEYTETSKQAAFRYPSRVEPLSLGVKLLLTTSFLQRTHNGMGTHSRPVFSTQQDLDKPCPLKISGDEKQMDHKSPKQTKRAVASWPLKLGFVLTFGMIRFGRYGPAPY